MGITSVTAARKRRLTRLRATALPTFLLAVKPIPTEASTEASTPLPARPDSARPSATCKTRPGAAWRRPVLATRKKSARLFRRTSPNSSCRISPCPNSLCTDWPNRKFQRKKLRCNSGRFHPMPKAACGPLTDGLPEDGDHQRSTCDDENRAGVCEPVCWVGRYVSPFNLHSIIRPIRGQKQDALYTVSIAGSQRRQGVLRHCFA